METTVNKVLILSTVLGILFLRFFWGGEKNLAEDWLGTKKSDSANLRDGRDQHNSQIPDFLGWVARSKTIKDIDTKRFLGGKELKSGISMIVENALSYNNDKENEITIMATDQTKNWHSRHLPWANSLKKRKGWIFNDICPGACANGQEILWGRKHQLCPMMFRPEMRLFMRHLHPGTRVLEYGAGISTTYYSQCVKQYDTVETNLEWCRSLQEHTPPNVKVHCKPKTVSHSEFLKQICIVNPDVVLIDGDNRPEIAKAIIPFISEQTDIFLHDYSEIRVKKLGYGKILEDFDMVAFASQSLAKFKLKKKHVKGRNQQKCKY